MKWTAIREIAIALAESHPTVDPMTVRFIDLQHWVMELPGFSDRPERCNEKILEAIQMTWLEERD